MNCREAFYGGAAGGGKSDALLMAALQYVDIPGYNAILIRDSYQNLNKPEALVPRSHEWLQPTDAAWIGEKKLWRFPSGATLSFGYLDGPYDHFNYQSAEFQFVGIDECVAIREHQALYMFSRLRRVKAHKVPIRYRTASNPPQRLQAERGDWVKTRYVNPKTRRQGIVFISARIDDNPYLDKDEYVYSLNKLDPITRQQLLLGDWDVNIKGRMFDRSWFKLAKEAPSVFTQTVRYWDLAATEEDPEKEPAYTAGCRMGKTTDGLYYITSMMRFRHAPRQVEALVRQAADLDKKGVWIWMEQEPGSSGVNTIDHYRRNVLPEFVFKGDKVTGNKIERASPFASQAEAGNVVLVEGHWNEQFLEEIEFFPDGKFKDQTDAASGAFEKLANVGVIGIRIV